MKKQRGLLALLLSAGLLTGLTGTAAAAETGYSDVAPGAWYAQAVEWARDRGWMAGTGEGTFDPEGTMTRAMLAMVLYRASGSPAVTGTDPYADTDGDAWYGDAVLWAAREGLVSGYSAGTFGPDDPVTREQTACILWRYAESPEAGPGQDFADEGDISPYAVQAVDWARAEGIVSGMEDGRFLPQASTTRAQMAVILHSCLSEEGPAQSEEGPAQPEERPDAGGRPSAGTDPVRPGPSESGIPEQEPQPSPGPEEEQTPPSGEGQEPEPGTGEDEGGSDWEEEEPGTAPEPEEPAQSLVMEQHPAADGALGYWLYTPEDPEEGMPLIVYLHGGSGKGEDLDELIGLEGFPRWLWLGDLGRVPAYVLIPQLPETERGWSQAGERLMSLIEETVQEYGIDRSSISLTGHSMGGTGTWSLGAAYPQVFARIAPLSGSVMETQIVKVAAALKEVPVWAFVGEADKVVSPEASRKVVAAINEMGGEAKVVCFPGAAHEDVPGRVYKNDMIPILQWLTGENG